MRTVSATKIFAPRGIVHIVSLHYFKNCFSISFLSAHICSSSLMVTWFDVPVIAASAYYVPVSPLILCNFLDICCFFLRLILTFKLWRLTAQFFSPLHIRWWSGHLPLPTRLSLIAVRAIYYVCAVFVASGAACLFWLFLCSAPTSELAPNAEPVNEPTYEPSVPYGAWAHS